VTCARTRATCVPALRISSTSPQQMIGVMPAAMTA